ncbi:MAG: Lar family restriction alleviation protein [Clostridia bacterium]|nr:Lar family restriction alleviation protein [Clostridia bacterium]
MGQKLPETKSCPFCEGETRIEKGVQMFAVQCLNAKCGANTIFVGKEFDPWQLAVAWRKRTSEIHEGNSFVKQKGADIKPPLKLKACPFCGNINLNYRIVFGKSQIECGSCGADVGFYSAINGTDACERWNRRVENDDT